MVSGRFTIVVALTLAMLGCSAGSDDAPSTDTTTSTTTEVESSQSSRPASSSEPDSASSEPTDLDQVTVDLQSLVDRYDRAVATILANPQVAADQDHEAVRAYLSLFVPESEFATGALRSWAAMTDRHYQPGPSGQMFQSTVSDVAFGADPGEATFKVCLQRSFEVLDNENRVVSAEAGWNAAEGVALVVDGDWRLRDLTQVPPEGCDQGAGDA